MTENNQYSSFSSDDSVPIKYQPAQDPKADSLYFRKFERSLLIVVLLELLLGGNGYLMEVAGIRLRVLLYLVCMLWVGVRLLSRPKAKLPRLVIGFSLAFLLLTAFGILVGLLNGNSLADMFIELKGMMYFPMLLFFAIAIKDQEDINLVSRLIVVCGLIQATLYLSVLLMMYSNLISSSKIYLLLLPSDEFMFRHYAGQKIFVGFFFKGFLHLGISTLFILFQPGKTKLWLALLTIMALALSLTRGFMLALILSVLLGIFLMRDKQRILTSLAFVIVGTGVLYHALQIEADLLCAVDQPKDAEQKFCLSERRKILKLKNSVHSPRHQKAQALNPKNSFMRMGDSMRTTDLKDVINQLDLSMIFFGRGIGTPIVDRQRIEMTFVEIFYKQGIWGLLFWLSLSGTNFLLFWRIKRDHRSEALPFLLASVFVYFASLTNNFLTGSVGMSIIHICITALILIRKMQSQPELSERKSYQ